MTRDEQFVVSRDYDSRDFGPRDFGPDKSQLIEGRRRPDPYYHPSPLRGPLNYSGYGPEIQDGGRGLVKSADSDEGIHSLGEDQNGFGDTFKSMGSRTMSPVGTDVSRSATPKKSKSFKSVEGGKLTAGPSPQRTFYTFEKVREGITNYVHHLRNRIGELTEKFERGFFGQYGTVSGRFWSETPERFQGSDGFKPISSPIPNTNPVSLEKRIKNAERLLKHLEYHCTKVDKLHDDYLQNHKLREGAKAMSFAYCDPNNLVSSTKSMKESLQSLDVERKTCEVAMCGIETKLQELMGSYHFCIKEIAGFARIGSGDQFEIVVRYGSLKKFKAHCKVNRKLEQHWDRRGAAFPCLIHDVIELKAKELKTFGKNAQLIRTILDPIEMLSIVPMLKFVKLNQNGSLKLNMLFFWNPLGNEPAEELEYLYGQQFIDAFLTTPTPSEFQLPFLPVLDHVTTTGPSPAPPTSQTLPARIRPATAIGPSIDQWNREQRQPRDKPFSPSIDQWERERARDKPLDESFDQWDRKQGRDKPIGSSLDQWDREKARNKPIDPSIDQWDRELPRNKRNVRKTLDPYLYTSAGLGPVGDQPLESTVPNEDSSRRGPGLQRSYMVEEQVAGYDFGENRQLGGTQPVGYRDDTETSGQLAQKRVGPVEKGRPRPFTTYENYRQQEAQPYAVGQNYGASGSGVRSAPPSTPSPQDFSLGRDFGHALDDVTDAIQLRDAGPTIREPMELEEIQTMLQQFRTHLRDSSRDNKKGGRRNKGSGVGGKGDYGNGGDGIYLGSLFRKNVGSGQNGGDDPYGTGRFGYRNDVEKQNGARVLEDKRRTYNFETTPTTYYSYEEENEKIVTRRPDSRNVDMALKCFDFLGPPSTTSRNTPLNQSRDTLQYQPDQQTYYYGQGSTFKPDPARPARVIPGRKTPIDSGMESGSCEGDTGDGRQQYQHQHPMLLTTGDPNVDRVIHVHLILLSQGLQKLTHSLDKPLTRARLLKLVNIHALCLEILYEIVVHGVPQDQNVIVAIINKYSNLNGWGNVNQIVDFWKRMNGSSSFLSGHVYRIQTNLERHYLAFLLEKHSQQVISLVFPKEINQIQQIVPAGLDQIEDVRHCVTLLQFVLYLKMHGIQDFKIHLEEIARELEFRDLFATGNQNGIIKFLLSLRNELPPGDSFDVICRLLCNNEEINRFTVSYLNRVQSNFRIRGTAVSQALTCLESNESIIRCGACRALQHLKATECIPQLAQTFQRDPNFRVKEFARISLLNMGPAGIRAYDEILSSGSNHPVSADYRAGNGARQQFGTRSALYDVDSKL